VRRGGLAYGMLRRGQRAAIVSTSIPLPVLMYKVAICHLSSVYYCYAISGTLFPIRGGRPALPVPSPAAISLFSLSSHHTWPPCGAGMTSV
jgi:hypothetical protein